MFMVSTTDMAERQRRVLEELAELGLTVARELAAKLAEAQTPEAAQGFALAFHRVSRAVRLTLALETRLDKERRQNRSEAAVETARAVQARKAQVRVGVARVLGPEVEQDDVNRFYDELDRHLDEDALFERFLEGPVEACIARIRKELGLPAEDPPPIPYPPPAWARPPDPDLPSPFPLEGGRVRDGSGALSGMI
jgi:hypothetical protein